MTKLSKNALELIATLSAGGIALDRDQQQAIGSICRHAATFRRLQEMRCNGPWWASTPSAANGDWAAWEATLNKRQSSAEKHIWHYVDRIAPQVVRPVFQGDPRGVTVKLKLVNRLAHLHDAFDHSGICVPGS